MYIGTRVGDRRNMGQSRHAGTHATQTLTAQGQWHTRKLERDTARRSLVDPRLSRSRLEFGDGCPVVYHQKDEFAVRLTQFESFQPELVLFAVCVPCACRFVCPCFDDAYDLGFYVLDSVLDDLSNTHRRTRRKLRFVHDIIASVAPAARPD